MNRQITIKIQPVVVVYNTNCNDSSSVKALVSMGIKPIIIDNSTSDFGNSKYCRENGLVYHSMGGNVGLSRAYNGALTILPEDVELIQWFDDDTIIPNDFLAEVQEYIVDHPDFNVYVPVVKSGEKSEILSPSLLVNAFTYKISDINELKARQFSAINSGMIIRREVFDKYRYDENMFLDCIDHDFMCYCWKQKVPIAIMPNAILRQRFSGDEKADRRTSMRRYKIFSRDFKIFRKKNRCSIFSTEFFLFRRFISIIK